MEAPKWIFRNKLINLNVLKGKKIKMFYNSAFFFFPSLLNPFNPPVVSLAKYLMKSSTSRPPCKKIMVKKVFKI